MVTPTPAPPSDDLNVLSVADVTDWLLGFSGPEGQKQLTDQGSIGLLGIRDEARQLDRALQILINLVPGGSSNGVAPTTGGRNQPVVGVDGGVGFLQKIEAVTSGLTAPRGKPDPEAVQKDIVALRDHPDIVTLEPSVRVDAVQRVTSLRTTLLGVDGRHPQSEATVQELLLLLIQGAPPDNHRHPPPSPAFQRVIVGGERGSGSGDNLDLGRIVQRVVSEAFAQATFLGNTGQSGTSSLPYAAMGAGPVSMYAQNLASIPPSQRTAAAAGLASQVSTEQAVLQQQIGPVVSAALTTVERQQPLSQIIDFAEFAALKSAVSSDLSLLLAEAGRSDGPRPALVKLYRERLSDRTDRLRALAVVEAEQAKQDGGFDSTPEASRRALIELLRQQAAMIGQVWEAFFALVRTDTFSRILIRVQQQLESTSSATRQWLGELDGVGLTQDERRLAQIGSPSQPLRQALANPDVADLLRTLDGHVHDVANVQLPNGSKR